MDYGAIISFLTSKTGIFAALGALLSLVLAFIKLYQTIRKSKFLSRADLIVSSLEEKERLVALPGHPVIHSRDREGAIYAGGLKIKITLAHNKAGDGDITIHAIKVSVNEFIAGEQAGLHYSVDFDKLIGREITPIRVFNIQLNGAVGHTLTYIDSEHAARQSNSDNLLDTDPSICFSLTKYDRSEELEINITANASGLYTLRLIFHYFIAGKCFERPTEPITIYASD